MFGVRHIPSNPTELLSAAAIALDVRPSTLSRLLKSFSQGSAMSRTMLAMASSFQLWEPTVRRE